MQRDFNGLGQMTSEWQEHDGAKDGSTLRVQYEYSFNPTGSNNHSRPEGVTYPDGTVMDYNYAANVDGRISRISSTEVVSHSLLEEYDYLGLGTVVKRVRAGTIRSDVTLSYVKLSGESTGDAGDKYTGLDRFGRVVDQRWWRVGGGSNVDRYQYTYDRNSNRTARTNVVTTNLNETYGYDNLNQLTSFAVTGTSKSWDYDATGNWDGVTTNSVTESRTHNKQNELLTATSQTSPTYDAAGNQTTDFSGRTFVYDAWNRTKQVNPSGGGSALRTYELDGLGRRIEETTGSDTTDFYYSSGWQLIEERVDDEAFAQYMWSGAGYVDEMIVRYRDADGNSGNGLEERLWVLQDANYNVTGLVTNSGTVLERYSYDPYGTATVYDASWNVRTGGSNYGWNYLHQGLRWDGDIGKIHNRRRDYDPAQGRFNSVDPKGFGAGDVSFYRYVGNSPSNQIDPSGLQQPGSVPAPSQILMRPGHASTPSFPGSSPANPNWGQSPGQPLVPTPPQPSRSSGPPALPPLEPVEPSFQRDWRTPAQILRDNRLNEIDDELRRKNLIPHQYLSLIAEQNRLLGGGTFGEACLRVGQIRSEAAFGRGRGATALARRSGSSRAASLRPYNVGGGHHVPAKSAFRGAKGYDPQTVLAIPTAELQRLGVKHIELVSPAQQRLYRAFAGTGKPITWEVVRTIETEALVCGGMKQGMAGATADAAIKALKQGGIAGPTRIPWGGE